MRAVRATSCRMPPAHTAQAGTIMVSFVFAAMLLTAFVLVSADASERSRRHVDTEIEQYNLKNVGQAVVTMAADRLWEDFLATTAGGPPKLGAIRNFLTNRGLTPTVYQTGAGATATTVTTAPHSLLQMGYTYAMGLPAAFNTGMPTYAGAQIIDLDAERRDVTGAVIMTVTARVSLDGSDAPARSRTVTQSFALAGKPFEGLGFALLSKNINCIMCHAEIDSTKRYWNRDPANYGTYAGIKVGSMESMRIRSTSAASGVAGTMYYRGILMDKNGTPLPNFNGTTITGYQLDAAGNVVENGSGAMTSTALPMVNETGLSGADATMPDSFPSVIPDGNGNKVVDDAEFQVMADAASGSISGGLRVNVPAGSSYTGTGMPAASNMGGITNSHAGNVVLYGTQANPIVINGNVAIDGDVALAGVIKGNGELVARGNVYVVGPLTYADGSAVVPATGKSERTYGLAADGSINQLALGAGGNILVGDYLSQKKAIGTPISGLENGGFNFTLSETTLFNRMEWSKTQTMLPGPGGVPVANPLYVPGYKPRYYTVSAGDPVVLFVGSRVYFDPATKTWMGKEHLSNWRDPTQWMTLQPGSPEYASAVVSPLNPKGSWLDTNDLYSMWNQMEAQEGGKPFGIDAMLYTNNSIMSLARKASGWKGQMLINGGIVAADTGILVPGNKKAPTPEGRKGLQLNYDGRLAAAFNLREDDTVTMRRLLIQ